MLAARPNSNIHSALAILHFDTAEARTVGPSFRTFRSIEFEIARNLSISGTARAALQVTIAHGEWSNYHISRTLTFPLILLKQPSINE